MTWLFIPYYILGVCIYTYRANKHWGMFILVPFTWLFILAIAAIWPLVLVIDYFENKKLLHYEQGNCNCDASSEPWADFYGEEPLY